VPIPNTLDFGFLFVASERGVLDIGFSQIWTQVFGLPLPGPGRGAVEKRHG
jgi:hypothetical protein